MSQGVFWVLNCVAVLAVAAGAIALVMPRIVLLSYRQHLFDEPAGRKIHSERVSRLGGIVFFPAMVFSVLLVAAVNMLSGSDVVGEALVGQPVGSVCGVCGMLLLYFTGFRDDLSALSPWMKLGVQVVCGLLLAFSGCRLVDMSGFLGVWSLGYGWSVAVTVCATVLVINAINFIDGIDGLASVVCGLCFVWQGCMGVSSGDYGIVLPAMAGIGVAGAFLYFNMRGVGGRRVFMGDTGSLTLGFLAVWLGLRLDMVASPGESGGGGLVMMATPLVVPCLDALRVVALRVVRGRNPLMADTTHLHHILYRGGLSPWCVSMALGGLSGAVMVLNLLVSGVWSANAVIWADAGLFVLFVVGVHGLRRRIPQ